MNLLGNVLAVHLVEDVLERRYVVVVPHGVDTVIHGDIPHAVAGEEIFNQEAGLQVIPTQSGQVFLCQVGTKKFFENLQAVHRRTTTRERLACELNS